MTRRKAVARTPKSASDNARTDFPRPDAATVAAGAPTHEKSERPSRPHAATIAKENDRAHGYTQDSGYQASGGYSANEDGPSQPGSGSGMGKPGNGHAHTDEQIRADVQQRLMRERAPRGSRLLVSVGDGIVTLRGEVDDHAERQRLAAVVRDVPSVREVREELDLREPRSSVN